MPVRYFLKYYFFIAVLWLFFLGVAVIGSLARVGGNYFFWVVVGSLVCGYLFLQVVLWYIAIRWGFCLLAPRLPVCLRLFILSLGLTLFIFWMERCSFFLFGFWEGIPIFQPLLLLLDSCGVRLLTGAIGVFWMLLILHMCFMSFLVGGRLAWAAGGSLLLLFVLGQCSVNGSLSPPDWLARCAVIRPPFTPNGRTDELVQIQRVAMAVADIATDTPWCDCIFMPESAVPFPLNASRAAYAALQSLSVGRIFCFGTHRVVGEKVFNVALCMADGKESFCHAKRHGMVGLERLPLWLQRYPSLMRGLAPLLGAGFFAQAGCREDWSCDRCDIGVATIAPRICSEFFYTHHIDLPSHVVVVALVNDAWFDGTLVVRLLWCCTRLKALVWRRAILYVSYRYTGLFDAAGRWFAI